MVPNNPLVYFRKRRVTYNRAVINLPTEPHTWNYISHCLYLAEQCFNQCDKIGTCVIYAQQCFLILQSSDILAGIFFQNNIYDIFLWRHDTGIISLFSPKQSLNKNNPDIGPGSAISCLHAAGLNPDWVDVQCATIFHKISSCILDSILWSTERYSKSSIAYYRVKEISHNCVWW